MSSFEEFKLRTDEVLAEIAAAARNAGRSPSEVRLLPVTKTHPAIVIEWVARAGLSAVGENRVQEAQEKKRSSVSQVRWELIGHLQSNKAKLAAELFDRIQSVDTEKLLQALDRAAGELGKTLPILLQVNAGDDPNKFGVEVDQAPVLLESALRKKNLRVEGLMTIAPLSEQTEIAERTFARLRAVRDSLAEKFKIQLSELSMGMSGDFPAAIRFGSTQVRVGTRLFGERPPVKPGP